MYNFIFRKKKLKLNTRLGAKYNATDDLRFKFAGGLYSQNLVSSVNDLDVINLFQGFLAGPEEAVFDPFSANGSPDSRLQTSFHGVAGVEYDFLPNLEVNVEGYYKGFTQLIQINRNKRVVQDPDFSVERGEAYGLDVSLRYEIKNFFLWSTYSLGFVNRDDGQQTYPTIFDRRHNANILMTYSLGAENEWEIAARWNGGTGFPLH